MILWFPDQCANLHLTSCEEPYPCAPWPKCSVRMVGLHAHQHSSKKRYSNLDSFQRFPRESGLSNLEFMRLVCCLLHYEGNNQFKIYNFDEWSNSFLLYEQGYKEGFVARLMRHGNIWHGTHAVFCPDPGQSHMSCVLTPLSFFYFRCSLWR